MKFSDIFQQHGQAYPVSIVDIKMNVTTKFGEKHVVKVNFAGQEADWFVAPATFQKQFVEKGVNVGDVCEITSVSNGTKSFYDVKKVGAGDPMSTPSSTPFAPTPLSSNAEVEKSKRKAIVKDIGIQHSGVLQSLLNSGKHDVEACKQMTRELVRWIRAESEALYDEELAADITD